MLSPSCLREAPLLLQQHHRGSHTVYILSFFLAASSQLCSAVAGETGNGRQPSPAVPRLRPVCCSVLIQYSVQQDYTEL